MDHSITTLPLRAPRQEPNLNMTDLPSEILDGICRLLCLHCQVEHVVIAYPGILPGAFEDQKVIARFSRCSRRLRDIAQPGLFHWYHDGEVDNHAQEVGRLVSFLRAILRNPTLAASTQALALYQPRKWTTFHDSEGFFRRAIEALGGYLLQQWRPVLSLENLHELAMAITPALSQLCLHRESPDSATWATWNYGMQNLKYLAFAGNFDLKEARNLLRWAPNLDTLIAPDCWGGGPGYIRIRPKFSGQPWDFMLARLRKLSLINVSLNELGPILRICPLLEDLEYFDEDLLSGLLSLDHHLGHLRTTLRRLCYSVFPAELTAAAHDSEGETVRSRQHWFFYYSSKLDDPWYPNFSAFPLLEQLELEQLVLYGPVFPSFDDPREDRSSRITIPNHLFRKLPPSLRRLRIGYVTYWPTIYRDLPALAEEPSRRFQRLQAVTLEVFKAPPEHQHRHLEERLRSVLGVTLLVCYVARSQFMSRGLLPAMPGNPRFVHEQVLYS